MSSKLGDTALRFSRLSRQFISALLVFTMLLPPSSASSAEQREIRRWRSANGLFEAEGTFGGLNGYTVEIHTLRLGTVKYPLDKLSDADQAYVKDVINREASKPVKDSSAEGLRSLVGNTIRVLDTEYVVKYVSVGVHNGHQGIRSLLLVEPGKWGEPRTFGAYMFPKLKIPGQEIVLEYDPQSRMLMEPAIAAKGRRAVAEARQLKQFQEARAEQLRREKAAQTAQARKAKLARLAGVNLSGVWRVNDKMAFVLRDDGRNVTIDTMVTDHCSLRNAVLYREVAGAQARSMNVVFKSDRSAKPRSVRWRFTLDSEYSAKVATQYVSWDSTGRETARKSVVLPCQKTMTLAEFDRRVNEKKNEFRDKMTMAAISAGVLIAAVGALGLAGAAAMGPGHMEKRLQPCPACGGDGQDWGDALAGTKCRNCRGTGDSWEEVFIPD